jgi:hypothetical protein
MKIPGFTAEASLKACRHHYGVVSPHAGAIGPVVQQLPKGSSDEIR